jgi:uncharacterized protein (TIGR00730 family)
MREIAAVTVYCSSSAKVKAVYFSAARELGSSIAANGWKLVYGGNHCGLMGELADSARAAGGRVVGITPRLLVDRGLADQKCDELVVTDDMRQRKGLLEQQGDAFVALPGGIGTFEEVFEILVGRQLGFHSKPIVLLNIDGYYDSFLDMLRHGLKEHFVRPGTLELLFVTDRIDAAMEYLRAYRATTPAPATPEVALRVAAE